MLRTVVKALVLLPFVFSCDVGDNARFNMDFMRQPEGGVLVNTVSAELAGGWDDTLVSGPLTAAYKRVITVRWMTPGGEHKKEVFTVTGDQETLSITTSFSAPAGLYLDKEFWVVAEWDDAGADRRVESNHAVCTVP